MTNAVMPMLNRVPSKVLAIVIHDLIFNPVTSSSVMIVAKVTAIVISPKRLNEGCWLWSWIANKTAQVLKASDRIDCKPTFLPTMSTASMNTPDIATTRESRFFSIIVALFNESVICKSTLLFLEKASVSAWDATYVWLMVVVWCWNLPFNISNVRRCLYFVSVLWCSSVIFCWWTCSTFVILAIGVW